MIFLVLLKDLSWCFEKDGSTSWSEDCGYSNLGCTDETACNYVVGSSQTYNVTVDDDGVITSVESSNPAIPLAEGYIPIEAEEGFEELLQSLDFSQLEDPVDISKALEKYHNEISAIIKIPIS